MKKTHFQFVILMIFFTVSSSLAQPPAEEPAFSPILSNWLEYTDASNALYHHLSQQAQELLQKRSAEVSQIRTKAAWQQRQQKIRQTLMNIVGPFPERTPLNARITGHVDSADYRVEQILLEPQPKFYMTACLFIPKEKSGKLPTVIYCSGHSPFGFRNPKYQHVIMNLVKKGFIVFAFDPIGQGERLLYVDPQTGESLVGRPTREHSYPGAQCFLIGSSVARHMIWDVIRAIDYVVTRKEVDTKRIGITGRSGGGTQSSYIAAFDNRVCAIATECYITNFARLYQTRGPQDAEQNFFHGILSGIDHPDLLMVWAPKPLLMTTTSRDFHSIQGARETAQELKTVYQAFAAEQQFDRVEDDAGHASTKTNREATYAFFQKYLNNPGDCTDVAVDTFSHGELQVTKTGQIQTSLGGRTIFEINRDEAEQVLAGRLKDVNISRIRQAAMHWSGYQPPQSTPDVVFFGAYNLDSMRVERYFMHGEGEYVIPFFLLKPLKQATFPAVVYLHPDGKSAAARQSFVRRLVSSGNAVVLPDMLGNGELGPGIFRGDAYDFKQGNANFNIWFGAIQIGRSLVGIHACDINRLLMYLQTRDDIQAKSIRAIGEETMAPALLHAAIFSKSISGVYLLNPIASYELLVLNKYYIPKSMLTAVPGGLKDYDLPDLCAVLAPTPLRIINPVDQDGEGLSSADVSGLYRNVEKRFQARQSESKFHVHTGLSNQEIAELLGK